MKHLFSTFALISLGCMSFACSAAVGPEEEAPSEAVGQKLCANVNGVNAVLASLAVATAKELHRWNAPVDFQWNSSSGQLDLSAAGRARCGGTCRNVQALLDLQKPEAYLQLIFPDGTKLNSYALRSVLKDGFDRQVRCNAWQGEYTTNGCWVDAHDLWFNFTNPGDCGKDYFFWPNKAGTSTRLPNMDRLQYQLLFVGSANNEFLNFRMTANDVIIDPTVGLTEGSTTSSGSCSAACSQFSASSLVGSCCQCNGVTKTFSRSPFSYDMYLCR